MLITVSTGLEMTVAERGVRVGTGTGGGVEVGAESDIAAGTVGTTRLATADGGTAATLTMSLCTDERENILGRGTGSRRCRLGEKGWFGTAISGASHRDSDDSHSHSLSLAWFHFARQQHSIQLS